MTFLKVSSSRSVSELYKVEVVFLSLLAVSYTHLDVYKRQAITMSLKDILDKVNDLDIYTYCLGQFKVGKLMNSPLRLSLIHI